MPRIATLEEKLYLPLRTAWAAKNGLSQESISYYTNALLLDIDRMPSPKSRKVILLGATRATAFVVDAALKAGHTQFILLGGKKIGNEHPRFSAYVNKRLSEDVRSLAKNTEQTEAAFAEKLLLRAGVSKNNIQRYPEDKSTNTGANMRVLKQLGFDKTSALEFYTSAGSARRALMTARKEFGNDPVLSTHNAYPTGVTPGNWSAEPIACAHMTGEAIKSLGDKALYVRQGYAVAIDLNQEAIKTSKFMRSAIGTHRSNQPS